MDYTQFIKPELFLLVPVLWLIGVMLKKTPKVACWLIPYVLGVVAIILSSLYVFSQEGISLMSTFTAITQGILLSGASVYGHQLVKQATSRS